MPPNIVRVPSLLLLSRGNIVIEGDDVLRHITEGKKVENTISTMGNEEPSAFSLNTGSAVVSDNYSFLDLDDMSAKGNAGIHQMHNYVPINGEDNIETPPDTYKPNTISNDGNSYDALLAQRANDIPDKKPRIQ